MVNLSRYKFILYYTDRKENQTTAVMSCISYNYFSSNLLSVSLLFSYFLRVFIRLRTVFFFLRVVLFFFPPVLGSVDLHASNNVLFSILYIYNESEQISNARKKKRHFRE